MTSLVIENIDPAKDLNETVSSLEFLLVSFCHNFDLNPKEAAGLLTQGGKYLGLIVAKGLKGRQSPILSWYQEIASRLPHLATLIEEEEANGSIHLILSALKSGFIAKDIKTAIKCSEVFVDLAHTLSESVLFTSAWTWFISEGGGLEACLLSCRRYGLFIKKHTVHVIVAFSKNHLYELFSQHMKSFLPSPIEYFATLNEFLPELCASIKSDLLREGVLEFWLNAGLNEGNELVSADRRLATINFVCEIWALVPECVDEELSGGILNLLKTGYRDRQSLMKYACLGKLFYLLSKFTQELNVYASTVYKTLTFSLVENYENLEDREFILSNFIVVFKEVESIPVGVLVDPLLKQIAPELSIVDFDFFNVVSMHPRLGETTALHLLDTLGKRIVNDIELAHVAFLPFLRIAQRFQEDSNVVEYLYRLVKHGIELSYKVASNKFGKEGVMRILAEDGLGKGKLLILQRNILLELTVKIVEIEIEAINLKINKELLKVNAMFKRTNAKDMPAAVELLKLFGNPHEFIEMYEKANPDKQIKAISSTNSVRSSSFNQRALREIEMARQRRMQRSAEIREIKEKEEEKQQKHIRKKLFSKRVDVKSHDKLLDGSFTFQVLSEQESSEVNQILKKYNKALKVLFSKYSSTGYINKNSNRSSFDYLVDQKSSLSVSEFYKMLKDQGVQSITVEDVNSIMKGFCHHYKTSRLRVSFSEFRNLLVQAAMCIYSKPPQDLSHLSPAIAVSHLINSSKEHSNIFNDADPGFGDKDVVEKLNAMLETNPSYPLPAGYKRITDTEVKIHYKVPVLPKVRMSVMVALEVMDDLISDLFNSHILEPLSVYNTSYRVKGVLPKIRISNSVDAGKAMSSKFHMKNVGITYHKAEYQTVLPPDLQVSPTIKYELAKLNTKYPRAMLMDVGKLVSDLTYSAEMKSPVLITPEDKPKVYNQALQNKEYSRELEEQKKAEREMKLRKRKYELEDELYRAKIKQAELLAEEEARRKEQLKIAAHKRATARAKREEEEYKKAEALQSWKLDREKAFHDRVAKVQVEKDRAEQEKQEKVRKFLKEEQQKLQKLLKETKKTSLTPTPGKKVFHKYF